MYSGLRFMSWSTHKGFSICAGISLGFNMCNIITIIVLNCIFFLIIMVITNVSIIIIIIVIVIITTGEETKWRKISRSC